MATKIIMPKLGMEMVSGTVSAWLLKEGERVNKGQIILQIETEKITFDVESAAEGILRRVLVLEGETSPVGGILGIIASKGETLDEASLSQHSPSPASPVQDAHISVLPPIDRMASDQQPREARSIATPAAKRLAREKGIDISLITGTGPDGRITERDVLASKSEGAKTVHLTREQSGIHLGARLPISRMRSVIDERLTKSWRAPHIYLATEVDASEMRGLRAELTPAIERQTGQQLSYDDILVRIVALAIEKHPHLNATLESDCIKIHQDINIGIAVALENGLVVPVLHRANSRSLAETVRLRSDLAARARGHRLSVEDVRGGTFSVTNLGMFGVDFFTAILNPPECGILAVGAIKDTPVVQAGEIVIRPIFNLVLGVDHRVVDGAVAAAFLKDLKGKLENSSKHLSAT